MLWQKLLQYQTLTPWSSYPDSSDVAVQQPHGIWQLATRTCPAAFVDNPAAGQALLQAITPAGIRTLRFPQLGTVSLLLHGLHDG